MNKVKFGNSVIEYSVVKSKRRKTSEIIVDKNGVMIRAPSSKPISEIKKIVEAKRRWIFKKQLQFKDHVTMQKSKTYSESFLKKRVRFFSNKIGLVPKKINIKKLKSRWGSATQNSILNFNVNLLKSPQNVIDYVVLHEVCHLKIHSHNHHFWRLLEHYMPDYRDRKKWLEVRGHTIF